MTSQRDQVMKGLNHLAGSDEIIGDIVSYCVNSYKADPSLQTMNKIKQYVSDTANSVSEHVLTIAHNLNRIIDTEANQIEVMSSQISYVHHRLKINQTYMSELYMTKFQTFPRPRPTLHILRQTVPDDQLPKFARPKKPWVRSKGVFIRYAVFDKISRKGGKGVSSRSPSGKHGGGGGSGYVSSEGSGGSGNGAKANGVHGNSNNIGYAGKDGIGFSNITGVSAAPRSSGLSISPYQQNQARISGGLTGVRSLQNVNGNVVQQPISFGQKSGLKGKKKQYGQQSQIQQPGGGPPPNPMAMIGKGGPPVPMMMGGGPPPVPMMGGGGGPPPLMGQGGGGPGSVQQNGGKSPVPKIGGPPPPPSF